MANNWRQQVFAPSHPEKYKGDASKIYLRSSWEISFARFLDKNPNVLQWACEEIAIPYYNPAAKRPARYFPDFWVKYQNKYGEIHIELIEIKPHKQVCRPKSSNKQDMVNWVVNQAKWAEAIKFCNNQGIKFRVLTEKSLFK